MQGGNEVMSLLTFKKITWPKCALMTMTQSVIDLVEKRACREGMNEQIKFLTGKGLKLF